MSLPPAQRFEDRIFAVPTGGYLWLSDYSKGDQKFRLGWWRGRVDGYGYAVQVAAWSTPKGRETLLIELIHGQSFCRRWEEWPSDMAISRRCRQLVQDVLAGRIGAVGLVAR